VADFASNHAGSSNRTATPNSQNRNKARDNSGKSVVAFVSGLVGLLVGNLILGPLAIGLGIAALRGANPRRGRAVLAIVLGVADLAVFAFLTLHSEAGHGVLWKFGS
jgi:predicted lipid-binding transport protein (Tim44 family)